MGDGLYTSFLSEVRALTTHNGSLYSGGFFNESGSITLSNLARWDGSAWSDAGGGTDGVVNTLASFDGRLYVGGEFAMAGSTSANNIAAYDDGSDPSGLAVPGENAVALLTFPNPATDQVYLESAILAGNKATVILYDLQGKQLSRQPLSTEDRAKGWVGLDLRHYAEGLYQVRVVSELGVATARVVKGR